MFEEVSGFEWERLFCGVITQIAVNVSINRGNNELEGPRVKTAESAPGVLPATWNSSISRECERPWRWLPGRCLRTCSSTWKASTGAVGSVGNHSTVPEPVRRDDQPAPAVTWELARFPSHLTINLEVPPTTYHVRSAVIYDPALSWALSVERCLHFAQLPWNTYLTPIASELVFTILICCGELIRPAWISHQRAKSPLCRSRRIPNTCARINTPQDRVAVNKPSPREPPPTTGMAVPK